MLVLADTNVLLRIVERQHAQHQAAVQASRTIATQGHVLVIVPQSIYEFWVVATRPIEVNGMAMTVGQAQAELGVIITKFRLLRDERTVFEHWQKLVVDNDVVGKRAHDARLVAAMLRHGVSHLLTFNKQDFARFSDITVVTPAEAATVPPVN